MAGVRILMQGGNAFDAAVATIAAINVVEPMTNGIGGDMFSINYIADSAKVTSNSVIVPITHALPKISVLISDERRYGSLNTRP